MNSTDLLQLVDNLQQAGKIHNLQRVCGISCCVVGIRVPFRLLYIERLDQREAMSDTQ